MKKLCLLSLPVVVALFVAIYGLLVDAQSTFREIDIERKATTRFNLAAPSDYTRQARLAVTPPVGGFGTNVSISGNTAALYSGAGAYVYIRSGEVWSQQAILVPSDGAAVTGSTTIDADTVVIGGPAANINGNANQGAAYVFVRNGTTWTEQQRLTASDGATGDAFGSGDRTQQAFGA